LSKITGGIGGSGQKGANKASSLQKSLHNPISPLGNSGHPDLTLNNMNNYNFDHIMDTKKGITSPLTTKNINNFLTNKSDLPDGSKGKTPVA
jgi:hypothetical protein